MDFLNQFPDQSTPKDNTSLLSFGDKTEQKGDLAFSFGTQSSAGEISFLNQMKSQQNESFQMDDNEKNIGGLNYLKTIYEIPESSNNFLASNDDFPLQNPMSCQMGLDFIRGGSQTNEDNFDFGNFQNSENKDNEPINVDINNLFKNNQLSPVETSKSESKNKYNELNVNVDKIFGMNSNQSNASGSSNKGNKGTINVNLNMKNNSGLNVNIDNNGKKGDNMNVNLNNIPVSNDSMNMKVNKADNDFNKNINTNFNKIPSYPNQNKNININHSSRSNPNVNSRQGANNNNNKATSIIKLNKNNSNADDVNNANNNFINTPINQIPSVNNMNKNIRQDNTNNTNMTNILPQFQNYGIKQQQIVKDKNNILDDIDKMVSLNIPMKSENKQVKNKNITNNNGFPSDLSEMFSSSTLVGKRADLEPKDKDLKNIDNLLNFTKENISSYNNISQNKPKVNIPDSNNLNNPLYFQKKPQVNSNNIVMKQLPGDSFDKKSQVIKLSKNEISNLSQKDRDTSKKNNDINNKTNNIPSKLEIAQKYNELAVRLNKIREQAKEYRNLGNYFSQLISANENYEFVYPNVIKKLLEEYCKRSENVLKLMKIKNNKMNEMNNEFDEEIRKYSLATSEQI